ncbi:MAG: symmetrical bis(5'-nucleosyl)-tetraphosphatase [Limnobacter sp.]|nr:symmetrical bis(5'-nucleosyl)-tetraphosphatase [Limnobacter sp.]
MSNYVIGDVQGCYDSLQALLQHINFSDTEDVLWFAGDLVNRGPRSLDTLRLIHGLATKSCAHTVLGNHDLHLLALWCESGKNSRFDTIAEIVASPEGKELIEWLRRQPLVLPLPKNDHSPNQHLLAHAGILPEWSFKQALQLSQEVQAVLSGPNWKVFMADLYGNKPNRWADDLEGHDRLRLIVNVCTRMRMLRVDGKIDLKFKLEPADAPEDLKAWFEFPRANSNNEDEGKIIFGHWSTLDQIENKVGFCLDTGCVWGGRLTALRLEDFKLFGVDALEPALPPVP